MKTPLRFLLVLLLAFHAATGPATATDREAEISRQLEALKARIAGIEDAQRQSMARRDQASAALRDAENAVASQSQALRETRRERDALETRRDELAVQRGELAAGLEADTEALAAELRAAWMTGGEPRLRLLLSQQDPDELGRMATWYGYFARDRAARVELLRERLAELAAVGQQLDEARQRLAAAETRQAAAVAALDAARVARAQALAELDADVARQDEAAARLREEAAALETLLEELRSAVADLTMPDVAPFAGQRGRLEWPVEGSVSRRFGERRGEGPPSNGVLIRAQRGTDIQAVWHGRVAYADWLPGLGLLLVLEHGDGFMSLYGHSEVLYRAVGDWVAAGEVLGQVGDSGGRDAAGLYFEIRNGAQPENPAAWLQSAGN